MCPLGHISIYGADSVGCIGRCLNGHLYAILRAWQIRNVISDAWDFSEGDSATVLEDVIAIERGLPEALASQISEIATLTDGWFEGGGVKIDESVIKRVEQLAHVISTSQYSHVLIFPRPDGGVQLEWQDEEYELDVLPDGTEVAYAFAEERDEDGQRAFDSSSQSAGSVISWLYEGGQWHRSPDGQRSDRTNI